MKSRCLEKRGQRGGRELERLLASHPSPQHKGRRAGRRPRGRPRRALRSTVRAAWPLLPCHALLDFLKSVSSSPLRHQPREAVNCSSPRAGEGWKRRSCGQGSVACMCEGTWRHLAMQSVIAAWLCLQ